MLRKYHLLLMAAMMCLVFFAALPATAQLQISDEELKKAATANVEVMRINQEYQQSLLQAKDQAQRQEHQRAANQKMVQAIQKAGLDGETYNQIMAQVNQDENLRRKFMEIKRQMAPPGRPPARRPPGR